MTHKRVECRVCKKIIMSCRCMKGVHNITYEVCSDCQKKRVITVGELKARLEKYDDNTKVLMCMDWTELDNIPDHLNQQWEDDLGDLTYNGREVILLNKHFK